MDKTIKSNLILKKVFYLLHFFKRINLVAHNKKLQKILNISILDYKRISGRFIEGEINGIGKEYGNNDNCNNQLLYEGELLNGRRNGKGKEYDSNSKVIFEGEYLKGKEMEKEKNIVVQDTYYLKENI